MHLRKLDYKWVALSNTTLGTLLAMINSSILLIALPNIFRGIGIDPLEPGNTGYLLWLLLGFLVVLAVLLVSLGRLGDMYGRVRMFNLGFAVFTGFSILLSVTWLHGGDGALWLILMRVGQGVGAAMVFANSSAILTDAFPHDERGLALGINSVAMVVGSFFGLVLGHTHQGTFGDPYYGGNANFIGWDLIGYPGIRTMVTAADQQKLEKNDLKPNHKSAYDYESFTKAPARAGSREEMKHGD